MRKPVARGASTLVFVPCGPVLAAGGTLPFGGKRGRRGQLPLDLPLQAPQRQLPCVGSYPRSRSIWSYVLTRLQAAAPRGRTVAQCSRQRPRSPLRGRAFGGLALDSLGAEGRRAGPLSRRSWRSRPPSPVRSCRLPVRLGRRGGVRAPFTGRCQSASKGSLRAVAWRLPNPTVCSVLR